MYCRRVLPQTYLFNTRLFTLQSCSRNVRAAVLTHVKERSESSAPEECPPCPDATVSISDAWDSYTSIKKHVLPEEHLCLGLPKILVLLRQSSIFTAKLNYMKRCLKTKFSPLSITSGTQMSKKLDIFSSESINSTVARVLPTNFTAKKGTLLVIASLFGSPLLLVSFKSIL